MASLRFYSPRVELTSLVQSYWILDSREVAPPEVRYMHPDGGSGFILSYGDPVWVDRQTQLGAVTAASILIAPCAICIAGILRLVGVRFRPGGAFSFFGTASPPQELSGTTELQGVYRLIEKTRTSSETVSVLDGWLMRRFEPRRLSPVAIAAVREIAVSHGAVRVGNIAESLHVTDRHLERLFRDQVGYPAKQLARIFRARKAKQWLAARPDLPLSGVAYELGYSDQANFIREFRAIIGLTPAIYRSLHKSSRRLPQLPSADPAV
jgi:AraC-like DNA-binding protein